jgi:hypothetical protein
MNEAEPGQVFEDRCFIFRTGSLPIVILDPQQHAAVAIVRRAPHVKGIDDVPEVEVAGGRGREACQHVQSG